MTSVFYHSEKKKNAIRKLLLAFLGKVYYTRKATCRCDGMVDVVDSKSTAGDSVPVRVRSPAPIKESILFGVLSFIYEEITDSNPFHARLRWSLARRRLDGDDTIRGAAEVVESGHRHQ